MEVIYSASNRDETGPGQVQELQERSRTIRSITRMIRSSFRTTFTGVVVGFSGVKGGYKKRFFFNIKAFNVKNNKQQFFITPFKPS